MLFIRLLSKSGPILLDRLETWEGSVGGEDGWLFFKSLDTGVTVPETASMVSFFEGPHVAAVAAGDAFAIRLETKGQSVDIPISFSPREDGKAPDARNVLFDAGGLAYPSHETPLTSLLTKDQRRELLDAVDRTKRRP